MFQRFLQATLLSAVLLFPAPALRAQAVSPLSNEVILIIRHAEREPTGPDLTPTGYQRASLYVKYFKSFEVDGKVRVPDALYSSADSKNARRCRETITPLSQALKIPINLTFKNKDVAGLAQYIEQNPGGKTVLICWHHEQIGNLLTAFGVNPLDLIPDNAWPEDRYNWVIELRYDDQGNLEPSLTKRITEHLLPQDKD